MSTLFYNILDTEFPLSMAHDVRLELPVEFQCKVRAQNWNRTSRIKPTCEIEWGQLALFWKKIGTEAGIDSGPITPRRRVRLTKKEKTKILKEYRKRGTKKVEKGS